MKTYYLCEWCGKLYENRKEAIECEVNDQSVSPRFKRGETVYFRSLTGREKCKILSIRRKSYELNLSTKAQSQFSENKQPSMVVKLSHYHFPKIRSGKRAPHLKQLETHFAYVVEFVNKHLRPCDKIRLIESYNLTKTLP